jgi:hypothetical protein
MACARALADAHRLAARLRDSDGSLTSVRAVVLPYVLGTSTPTRIELVGPDGRVTWSTAAGRAGMHVTQATLGWAGPPQADWLGRAIAGGGEAHASEDGTTVGVTVPLHMPASAGGAVALVATVDHRDDVAEDRDRFAVHQWFAFFASIALGLGLWALLVGFVSRPLSAMARAIEAEDFDAADLAPFLRRKDEIGVLARGVDASREARELRHAQDLERAARLESALEAGRPRGSKGSRSRRRCAAWATAWPSPRWSRRGCAAGCPIWASRASSRPGWRAPRARSSCRPGPSAMRRAGRSGASGRCAT